MPFDPARVQAVLFDLDGTLADTDDQFIRRAGEMMRRLNGLFPEHDPTHFLRWSLMVSETPLNLLMGLPDRLGLDGGSARTGIVTAAEIQNGRYRILKAGTPFDTPLSSGEE